MERDLDLVLSLRMPDNLFKSKVQPLVDCARVRRVVVVCDHPARISDHFTFPGLPRLVYQYPPRLLQKIFGRTPGRFLWLVRTCLRMPPDLVMSYALLFHGLQALLVSRMLGCKVIAQLIGGVSELKISSVRDHPLLRRLAKLPFGVAARLERWLCAWVRRFDALVVKGRKTQEMLRQMAIKTPVWICPGGVDVARFNCARVQGSDKMFDLITVSRLAQRKNLSTVIQVIQLVRVDFPALKALIIGSGPDQDRLYHQIKAAGLADTITLLSHRNDIEDFLARAKVFLLCSLSEGLSTAVTEAMAMGVPAVVSDVGDMSDLVRPGHTGYLVSGPFRAEEYAAAITRLLRDESLRLELGDNARARVADDYSVAAETVRWNQCLDQLFPVQKV